MKFEGLTQAQVAAKDRRITIEAEIAELQARLASHDWYYSRKTRNGKEPPPGIAAEDDAAAERISELRAELAGM